MKLASIEVIKSIKPHPNADRLELAQVLGWQSVVQKGIHKEGDKIVFIPIDTIVPNCSWSAFLQDKENPTKPIRIKMVKLRGEYSAGIIVPIKEFPAMFNVMEEGQDVSEILGVQKYVKEVPAHLQGENAGDFPTHLACKTDEDNGLSNLDIIQDCIKDYEVTITLKLDGSSCTVICENGEIIQVCSRNLSKKYSEDNGFWKAAKKLRIPVGFTGVLQGELCGPGIQKNPLKIEDLELFIFQIKKQSGEYMNYQEMKGFCNVELGCNVVPLVHEASFVGCSLEDAIKKLQDLADIQIYENSKQPAEGIVVRPKDYRKSYQSRRPLGFKILNRNYKDN